MLGAFLLQIILITLNALNVNRSDFLKRNEIKTGSKEWGRKSRKTDVLNKTASTFSGYDSGRNYPCGVTGQCVCSG